MKFAIITHAAHKVDKNTFFAYEPYVREMNLWMKYVSETTIISPMSSASISPIESEYNAGNIHHVQVPRFHFLDLKHSIQALCVLPLICYKIFKVMYWADHIHLRCPGNMGLLGCLVQLLFPSKPKTVKYAGNWDPKSKQPLSYRFQKWIVSNTFFTKNCKVLVYGDWKNQTKNIMPFFTASYRADEIELQVKKELKETIKFVYVGAFTKSKQPMLSVRVIEDLLQKGHKVQLDMYGAGEELKNVRDYIASKNLESSIFTHGNQSKEIVKRAFQVSHFLLFISKSEGWPKVVAEAMFWRCLPISSKVSCVPFMLDNGNRGSLVNPNRAEIVDKVEQYLFDSKEYQTKVLNALQWSQKYTLDRFESEIAKFIASC